MTKQERQRNIEILRKRKKEVASSKEAARDFLVGAGICTPKGNLRKAYR